MAKLQSGTIVYGNLTVNTSANVLANLTVGGNINLIGNIYQNGALFTGGGGSGSNYQIYSGASNVTVAASLVNVAINSTNVASFTSSGLTVVGNLTVTGNIALAGNVVTTVTYITGNVGEFFGNAQGFGALYSGVASGYTYEPQTISQHTANYNGYAQINIQNINSGNTATTDIVATADTGNTNQMFIDMGITSSTYSQSAYNLSYANDGYLYVTGNISGLSGTGNLLLYTTNPSDIIFATGGAATTNQIGRFINASNTFAVTGNISSTGYFIGNGSQLSGVVSYPGFQANSALPPANPKIGETWYDSSTGVIFEYITDGTNTVWIDISSPTTTSNNTTSVGSVFANLTVNGNLIVNSGYGNAAIAYGCRAWVSFGYSASTLTVYNQGSISSVTRNNTGDYTITFGFTMPDTTYAMIGTSGQPIGGSAPGGLIIKNQDNVLLSNTAIRIYTLNPTNSTATDYPYNYIAFFR